MTGLPPLEELLAYDRHLEGEAFIRGVMGQAVRRSHRRRRGWILGGSAVFALAVAMGIKPDNFTMFANLHLPLQRVGDLAAAVPASGLIVVLLITALVVGASKTVDSI